jgi:hypothetical protein
MDGKAGISDLSSSFFRQALPAEASLEEGSLEGRRRGVYFGDIARGVKIGPSEGGGRWGG